MAAFGRWLATNGYTNPTNAAISAPASSRPGTLQQNGGYPGDRFVWLPAGHSRQWAEEFADCLAAGDEDGAHTAAGAIEVKAPWSHNLAAEREMDAMVHHKNKATYL